MFLGTFRSLAGFGMRITGQLYDSTCGNTSEAHQGDEYETSLGKCKVNLRLLILRLRTCGLPDAIRLPFLIHLSA